MQNKCYTTGNWKSIDHVVGRREMRRGRHAIEYLGVCWCTTAKSSRKILVHFLGSFRILVHFFSSLRILVHFFGSIRILDHFIGSTRFRFIFLVHSESLHFYVLTWPKYSCASLTFEFLRIYLTKIFLSIPDTSISTYLLDQNIHAHPWFRQIYVHVPAQLKYSCAHSIPPFLRIYSTKIFMRTLGSAISTYMYLLNQNILAHTRFLHFYVSTRP